MKTNLIKRTSIMRILFIFLFAIIFSNELFAQQTPYISRMFGTNCTNDEIIFSVQGACQDPKWTISSGGTSTDGNYNGNTFRAKWTSPTNDAYVECECTGYGRRKSSVYVISNTQTATVSISASKTKVCYIGEEVTFTSTITNGGSSPTYVWSGATKVWSSSDNSQVRMLVEPGDDIGVTMRSSNSCTGPASSNRIPITGKTQPAFSVEILANDQIYNGDEFAGFNASINGGAPGGVSGVNYAWKLNNSSIGTNSFFLQLDPTTLSTNDEVSCTISKNDPCYGSLTDTGTFGVTIGVGITPTISVSLSTNSVGSSGGYVDFTASPGSNQYTLSNYVWYKNDVQEGTGPEESIFVNAADDDYITVTATASGTGLETTYASRTILPSQFQIDDPFELDDPGPVLGLSVVCQGTSNNYTSSPANNATDESWDLTPLEAGSINTETGSVSWDPDFTGTARVTKTVVNYEHQQQKSVWKDVTVEKPGAQKVIDDVSIFKTSDFTLANHYRVDDSFTWSGVGIANNELDIENIAAGIYPLQYEYGLNSCRFSGSMVVTIYDQPVISLVGEPEVEPGNFVSIKIDNYNNSLEYNWYRDAELANHLKVGNEVSTDLGGVYYVLAKTSDDFYSNSESIPLTQLIGHFQRNFIITDSYINEEQDQNNLPLENDAVNRQYVFYDGLGRDHQVVNQNASVSGLDLVKPIDYDGFGRKSINRLVYPEGTDGHFKNKYNENQASFYSGLYGSENGDVAYNEVEFEASPLQRPIASYAPGNAWSKTKENRPAKTNYLVANGDEILEWGVSNDRLRVKSSYSEARYYKIVTTDEHSKQTVEYKNQRGQVVLKKVQVSESDPQIEEDWLFTYYVYDFLEQLRFVVPPMAVKHYLTHGQNVPDDAVLITEPVNYEDVTSENNAKLAIVPPGSVTINAGTTLEPGADIYIIEAQEDNFVLNQPFVDRWTFQYRYDERQRMIEKRVPGSGWVFMVYDERDRLVMTQDANQRAKSTPEWTFTKYDQLNRPVLTGMIADTRSRTDIQTEVNALLDGSPYYETYTGTGALHGYDNTGYPTAVTAADLLTVTYYDNYDFSADGHWDLGDFTSENQAKTYVTGAKVRVDLPDGSYDWNESVTLYDSRYRVVSSVSKDYQDNYDSLVNEYYSLVHPLVVKTTHYHESALTNSADTITQVFDYDHADRLMSVSHQINSDPAVVILANEYNELGELIKKKLNAEGGGNFSQEVDYQYNIRGWLTKINDPVTPDPEDYFAMQLKYDEAGQYNGNIGATSWKNPFETTTNEYDYTYDPVNRLKSATYNSGAFSVPNIDYDANGNILALERKGLDDTGSTTDWDNLDYKYVGNQLTKVDDSGSADLGFKDGASASTEYEYDANGNMISDANKGIEKIEYNHLNLPIRVEMNVDGSDRIEYIYDAAGTKLAQIVYEGGTQIKRTDYQGAFIYEAKDADPSQLQFIQHEEGRIVYETDVNGDFVEYEYQYHLKDHLGNVRATFKEDGDEDTSEASFEPVVQTNESSYFTGYDGMVKITADLFNHTTGGNTSIRLNGSANEKEGLGKSLKVKPGDVIDMKVFVKYFIQSEVSGWTNVISTGVVNSIIANAAGVVIDGGGIGADANPFVDWSGKSNPTDAPEAYLNYMVFDEYFNQLYQGHKQISESAKENGNDVDHEKLEHSLTITESGYVYIYLSNEQGTTQPIDVFFDDFTVTQNHTPIVSKDDYYPFGLTFNSYARAASTENFMNTFQDQEYEEETGWVKFKWRNHQPDLGRFFNVDPLAEKYVYNSPYAFSENRVIDGVELEGLEWQNFRSKFNKPKDLSIKRPAANAQSQSYSVSVTNSNKSFSEVKDSFLSNPQGLLTNSKAEFNAPVDGDGNPTDFAKGSYIQIDISGPLNNSFVQVEDITSEENNVSASFVTMEGHVENGEITFGISTDEDGNMTFSINSKSEVDQGAAKLFESFARSEQMESWQEVLSNFVNMTGGEEQNRSTKVDGQEQEK